MHKIGVSGYTANREVVPAKGIPDGITFLLCYIFRRQIHVFKANIQLNCIEIKVPYTFGCFFQ
jgi:hypothetical protein